jgi:hypothetical protein
MPGALLTSERGLTVEVNYGRRLFDSAIARLTAEVPLVVNFGEKTHYDLNLVPKDYISAIQREFHAGVGRGQPRQNRDHDRNFPVRRRA